MAKVLSTKLNVNDLDRFTAMAKQRGETKSKLVKSIVLDYLNDSSKVDPKLVSSLRQLKACC